MLCCALAGEGDIYAIALYHTKQSLASITTATDAGEYSQLGSGVQKQRSPRPSPPVRLPSDLLPLREAPGVLSCPQIPPPPKSSFPSPEEQSAACLTRTRYVVFFFSFFSKYSYCHYLFPARFFTSPSSFIPSLTSVLLLVAWLPATGTKQRLGLCKWPRKSFSETARTPFVHLSISLLTGTLASTFSCAVFNRDVHLDENRKGTNGPLNCRRVHTRKKSHTECVFLVKSGNQMSNDPPVTISHFWHQPTYLMLPCFSVHFHQHLIG